MIVMMMIGRTLKCHRWKGATLGRTCATMSFQGHSTHRKEIVPQRRAQRSPLAPAGRVRDALERKLSHNGVPRGRPWPWLRAGPGHDALVRIALAGDAIPSNPNENKPNSHGVDDDCEEDDMPPLESHSRGRHLDESTPDSHCVDFPPTGWVPYGYRRLSPCGIISVNRMGALRL